MRVLRCSATLPGARRPLRPGRKVAKGVQCRQVVVSVSASLSSNPPSADSDGPSWPTLQGKLRYIAVLAAVFTIAPPCVPMLMSGGGGGNGFLHGFGGGGGGGFFNSIVPVAQAGAHPFGSACGLTRASSSNPTIEIGFCEVLSAEACNAMLLGQHMACLA